jgi:enoyl-[acyl-carrier-protein] reductase (NADH)
MSDLMLHGILNMPIDLWNDDFLNQKQRHNTYIAASVRIYELTDAIEKIQALLEKAGD